MSTRVRLRGLFAVLALLPVFGLARSVWAGPAKYDPETRSIRFTYTYAALTEGQYGEAAIGAPQTPSSEQDALVRTIVLKVSDALSKATAGRLKIASLDIVNDVKRADIVISLTGDPGRGGWAIPGAIEGRPGQIGLYYQTLAKEWEQDYVLTAAHEACHYIFGFVDEYNFPNGCPVSNPGGPGCLMDNYLSQGTRHGWYGRLCAADHNPNPQQRLSCQEICDKFFRDRNVTTNGPAGGDSSASSVVADRTNSIVDGITRATIAKVKEEAEALSKGKKTSPLSSINSLKSVAKSFFESQLKQNGVSLSSDEVGNTVDGILKQTASIVKFAIPPRFDPIVELIAKFAQAKSKELQEKMPKDGEATRRQKIAKALLAFVGGLGSNAPTVDGPLTSEEKQYLENVAMQAAIATEEKKTNDELYQATLAHIKLSREIARNVLDIASESGVPGIEKRLAAAGEVDADLRKYMPGRTASSGFGLRRTIIIDPDPLDPRQDYVVTQSGIYRYADLREQYLTIFQKLIERARIELLTTELQKRRMQSRRELMGKARNDRLREERDRRIAELSDRSKIRTQREADLRELLSEVSLQIRQNRVENIVMLVPPGGLARDMLAPFESLRRQLIIKGDVRIDVVLIGAADIPFPLRDIAIGTGGSIVTLSDIDEVGAIAQRLKNEQTSGAWLVPPQQDEILGKYASHDGMDRSDAKTRWLLDDAKRGHFENGQPIQGAFLDVVSKVEAIYSHLDHNGCDSLRMELLHANVLPPGAIVLLNQALTDALGPPYTIPKPEPQPDPRAAKATDSTTPNGLRWELGYLGSLICLYNQRQAGLGDELKFEILEHLIRARELYAETKYLIATAEAAHAKLLSPEFDEESVFSSVYEVKLEELPQKFGVDTLVPLVLPVATGDASKTQADSKAVTPAGNSEQAKKPQAPAKGAMRSGSSLMGATALRVSMAREADDAKLPEKSGAAGAKATQDDARILIDAEKRKSLAATLKTKLDTLSGSKSSDRRTQLLTIARDKYAEALSITSNSLNDVQKADASRIVRELMYPHSTIDPTPNASTQSCFKDAQSGTQVRIPASILRLDASIIALADDLADHRYRDKSNGSPVTVAYILLKQDEVRLRAVKAFLDHIERELVDSIDVPLFRRIDRTAMVQANRKIQDAAPSFVAGVPGLISRPPLKPVDTVKIVNGQEQDNRNAIRLPRFYAENLRFDPKKEQGEFELVIGLAQALPGVDISAVRDLDMDKLPELRLYNDNGQLLNTPTLRLDQDLSTPTCLIYRFSPEFGETGWYQAALILKDEQLARIAADRINYTFSVASSRPNFRLNAALVQMAPDPELVPPPPNRGLARVMDRRAKVEVQVFGGSSVRNAQVTGVLHKLDEGTGKILPIAQDFHDDGKTYGDLKEGDGVYTTIIPLDQVDTGKEYRLLIKAESTPQSTNIPVEDPNEGDADRRAAAIKMGVKSVRAEVPNPLPRTAPVEKSVIFQRATSIQIRVER